MNYKFLFKDVYKRQSKGEFKGEMGDLTIKVSLGKDTITISDRGIGLTAEAVSYTHLDVYKRQQLLSLPMVKIMKVGQ